ncbi:MAG TPA: hypothetical protein VK203_03110, partial [Nostocaceae cyanobacterium]|nr:hypothetical protein [Nostocaceae cyanobacterium]
MSNLRAWLADKSPEEQEHFLGEVPRLWVEGGSFDQFCRLLANYDFIEAKINHSQFGVQALIEDYDLIDDVLSTDAEYTATAKALKLIQGALRLSSHVLNQDKKQLAGQLTGRLLSFHQPEITGLIQQVIATPNTGFRCLTSSLTPPGGALIRTLEGHRFWVRAVAITPDGQSVISGSDDMTIKVWDLKSGSEKFTLTGHSSYVNAVAITPDGQSVISGSDDMTIKVWDLKS